MKSKKILGMKLLFVTILGIAGFLPMAMAATETVDGIAWYYDTHEDGTAYIWGSDLASTTGAITIPEALGGYSLTSISGNSFRWCLALRSVTIPNSVTNIGDSAFRSCTNLVRVALGNGVTYIGVAAFRECYSLVSINIPDGVTSIGSYAFQSCSNLRNLVIPDSVTNIGNAVFSQGCGLKTLSVPESWKSMYVHDWTGQNVFWREYASVPSGCTVEYRAPQPQLLLEETSRTFAEEEATGQELEVKANVAWTAQSSESWLTLKAASGTGNGTIEYDVAANPGTAERTGSITVTGGGLTCIFLAKQAGKTETQRTPVGVPCQWLEENAADILASTDGDYEAAAMALGANGLPVWQCYVAGLATTDSEATLKMTSISFVNGGPVVAWEPDLNKYGTTNARTYTVQGKAAMEDAWGVTNAASRFFRVLVEMP